MYIYIKQKNPKTLKVSCEVPFHITRFSILTARARDVAQPSQSK